MDFNHDLAEIQTANYANDTIECLKQSRANSTFAIVSVDSRFQELTFLNFRPLPRISPRRWANLLINGKHPVNLRPHQPPSLHFF